MPELSFLDSLSTTFSGEYFYSIAALFSGLAYLLGNILWLRILLVCAAILYIVSGISLGITSMVGWNAAYLVINLYHMTVLLLDRITITLPNEIKDIYPVFFSQMSTREFKKLLMINSFNQFEDNTIIQESDITDKLFIVLNGKVNIVRENKTIATLKPGDLIGEMSFMSNEPASASAIANGQVLCAYWTHANLDKLKTKNRDTYNTFISIIGCDLVRKLKHKNNVETQIVSKVDII